MTECNAIIEVYNEIDTLKRENKKLNELCVIYDFEVGRLGKKNEELKQFKDKVFKVIDEKIIECEKAVEEIRFGDKDSYIVKHDVASKILEELKKEITE